MKMPKNYDKTEEYGTFRSLPPGGYVVKILKIEERQSKKGLPQLKVAIDIAEGDYEHYFTDLFNKRKASSEFNAKWPANAICYINVVDDKGECHKSFKSFCGALEKCGYKVWSEAEDFMIGNIVGNIVGLTFGREEYEWDGKVRWSTKPNFFCSVEDIHAGNFNVPADKPLAKPTEPNGFSAVADDDVPF